MLLMDHTLPSASMNGPSAIPTKVGSGEGTTATGGVDVGGPHDADGDVFDHQRLLLFSCHITPSL
jgi:hypothetical protein